MSRCVSLVHPPLPAIPALEMCSDALHCFQPRGFAEQIVKLWQKRMCTWNHFNSHFDVYFSAFGILWIVSRLNTRPFLPALVIQAPGDFSHFAICFLVKIQDSQPFQKKDFEIGKGLVKYRCSFLVTLQRCPRHDAPWPFQQGTSRRGTASNGCAGSKASVVELSPRAGNIVQRSRMERRS